MEQIEIELLLEAIYRVYGYEYRNYAYQFLRRRIFHRMRAERLLTISGYYRVRRTGLHISSYHRQLFIWC
ncbi:hypothetical protein HA075_26220 [bacterium BFN5]|nr:hypothetical protein HA075_26220 [bacterium BFN5]